ncbi:L-fucose/L-arabinose isomerase family protein [Bacteroidota bacterium]
MSEIKNIPEIKTGLVAVSRDCFPVELSRKRRIVVAGECKRKGIPVTELETIVENEKHVLEVLDEAAKKGINALVIYLGNFGPEGPLTMLAQKFDGPVMLVAASEETGENLLSDRGDAYCGLLSASYNTGLRNIRPYIPEYPVGMPDEIADMIYGFIPVARVVLGLKKLKIFSFGPRPHDFLACNAPIKPLFDMGIEIMENSELDLYEKYIASEGDSRIPDVIKDMETELADGNKHPGVLPKLAQYEVALSNFMEENIGASEFGVFANKCWPAFQTSFGFVPCFVNSRFAERGIPIACEADIYGALSEYMLTLASNLPATLLDVNNTVPRDMVKGAKNQVGDYKHTDLFMGFHCGNTCSACMATKSMEHQLIMHRLLEPDSEPNITRGTLEGQIQPGETTIFRFQSTAEGILKAYAAEGEILDVDPKSFGCIAVFAIKEMGRFYRHVLIEKKFPHHTGVGFRHIGKTLFAACRMLGVDDFGFNQPTGMLYASENPFG